MTNWAQRWVASGLSVSAVVLVLGLAAGPSAQAQDSSLYKIYNNVGHSVGDECYSRNEAWVVGGGQSIAMPFTPKADAKLTVMTIGLLTCMYGCGPDGGIVTLNEDSNGLPGNVIHTWKFKKLGKFVWRGCYLTGRKSKQGIDLKNGTQYWLVAPTSQASTDLWIYTYENLLWGHFAYEENNGGWIPVDNYLGAFGLFGKKAK